MRDYQRLLINSTVKANVVYNSKTPNDLYPEGDYIRGGGEGGDVSSSDDNSDQRQW